MCAPEVAIGWSFALFFGERRAGRGDWHAHNAALEAEMAVRPPPAGEVPLSRRLFSDESAWQSCVNTDNRMCISETAALQG